MKKLLIVIFCVVVLLGFLVGAIWAFSGMIDKKRNDRITIQKEIRSMEMRQNTVKGLEQLFKAVDERKEEIENIFVDERSVVRVIEEFERTAISAGIALTLESASLPTSKESRGPEFQLRVEGSFDGIVRYLRLLEVMPFQFSFDDIGIEKQTVKEDAWSGVIRLTLLSFMMSP